MTRIAVWLAVVSALVVAPASHAAVISFDDLAPSGRDGQGVTVTTAYAGQGVTFASPQAFDYAKGAQPNPGFAHSPNVAVEPCPAGEFCAAPLRADFTANQRLVRVWVGWSSPLRAAAGVRLTAYDAAGTVVATTNATLPANPAAATPIRTPLAVDLPTARIRRVDVSVTTNGGLALGLAVDDVEFSAATSPTPTPTMSTPTATATAMQSPCAAGAPTVTLDQPADGATVTSDAFPIAGTVDGRGAPITDAALLVSGRTGALFPQTISANGGPFSTSYGGLLDFGVNRVAVRAANCAGSTTSDTRSVIRAVRQPGPVADACPLQPDNPAVHVVRGRDDLIAQLNAGFRGQLIVPSGSDIDLTGFPDLKLAPGVQLIGERGELGRRPVLHTDHVADNVSMFDARTDVCVEGLDLRGPTSGREPNLMDYYAIEVHEAPGEFHVPGVQPVIIADNELHAWPGGAVHALGTVGWPDLVAPPNDHRGMRRDDAPMVRVERNYIHHNARNGGGYGVVVGGSAYVTIVGNVFDLNRHDVTDDGQSRSGYIARFNYSQQGGFRYNADRYWGQHYDVHGTTENDHHWTGGDAGEYEQISHNTIRGAQAYHCHPTGCAHRHALELRGRPTVGIDFTDNVLVAEADDAVAKRGGDDPRLQQGTDAVFNLNSRANHFDTDYSSKLAAGDFDGDGRTDVLLTTGTGWFFSRAGQTPWEFLRPSSALTDDQGFADIDNDGRTDVLHRNASGELGYWPSGASGFKPLTTSPVPMRDIRFGDFDHDGRTDMFYTRDHQWQVWYGNTQQWTPKQTSAFPIGKLAVGEFDDTPGADVLASRPGGWFVSSGAAEAFVRINDRRRDSLAKAVVADFDGDGRSDIAFDDAGTWNYSRDGRDPLTRLRRKAGAVGPLERLPIGHFDGEPKATVLAYGPSSSNRLAIWHGLGAQADLANWALSNQR